MTMYRMASGVRQGFAALAANPPHRRSPPAAPLPLPLLPAPNPTQSRSSSPCSTLLALARLCPVVSVTIYTRERDERMLEASSLEGDGHVRDHRCHRARDPRLSRKPHGRSRSADDERT